LPEAEVDDFLVAEGDSQTIRPVEPGDLATEGPKVCSMAA